MGKKYTEADFLPEGTSAPNTVDNSMQLLQNFSQGLLQKPAAQAGPGFMNKAAYYGGKYGPTALGTTIGSMAPGGGTILGAGLGAGAGAAMGRSLQNLGQSVSNQITPGSAAQKSPGQLIMEPTTDALAQGLTAGMAQGVGNIAMKPASAYVSGLTGVKPNLTAEALSHISKVFSSPSVEIAGENIGAIAAKGGLKTGTEGYKLATASLLGKKAVTDEFGTDTTMAMARLLRETGLDAATPQELYSTGEGLRKAISASKFADPHGQFSQNFGMYAQQLSDIETKLESVIPGYAQSRLGYTRALAKEAMSSLTPLNRNSSTNQLKTMAMTYQGLRGAAGIAGAYEGYQGKADPAAMLLGAAMMSPLMVSGVLRGGSMAASIQIPQTLGRMGVAAATPVSQGNGLTNALSMGGQPQPNFMPDMASQGQQ